MVDDETDYTELMRPWLSPLYDFRAFKNGEEFLSALKTLVPEVVILDLYLPGADGFDLCRRLHSIKGLEIVPVLFLTGSEQVEDYRKSMVAGGDAFLIKPVGRAQLLAAISSLLPHPVMQDDGGSD